MQQLVDANNRVYEDEQLDFKHGAPKEEDIDRIWSKALGAFANNQGGVVVWGVQADRDNPRKLDFAHRLALAPDVERLRDRLTQKYRFLTDPPLGNVEVVAIPIHRNASEGFVVCYIPEGPQKAYRSLKASFPYYIRIGSDAAEIGAGLLRQLFYPARSYKLSLHIGAQKTVPPILRLGGKEIGVNHNGRCIEFGVKNDGEFSAYEAMVLVTLGKVPLVKWNWERLERNTGWATFIDGAIPMPSPLHPSLRGLANVMAVGTVKPPDTPWSFRVFAKDMPPFHVEIPHSSLPVETGEPLIIPVEL